MHPIAVLRASFLAVTAATAAVFIAACGTGDAQSPTRTPLAEKWLTRARQSYKTGDFDDARTSIASALQTSPQDPEIRSLDARIALAHLDYAKAASLTEGVATSDAHAIRGRAFWYAGDLEQAADEFEALLQDPSVKDPWARDIAKLARQGQGRHPFSIEGGLVGAVEMPPAWPVMVVPCELEGEQILAMVATGVGELIVDSGSRHEPAWVNLRFDRVEVKDVPALTQDLSGISHQLGVSIRALLGANLLRHVHATFDRRGDQFVVRKDEPTPPPDASRVPLWYVRGGGMMLHANVSSGPDGQALLLVDTAAAYPVALEDAVWRRAGVDPATLKPEPSVPGLRSGTLPSFRFAGFDMPQMLGVSGAPQLGDLAQNVDVDVAGIMGAGLMALFRVTFADDGRFIWLEPDPMLTSGGADRAGGARPAPSGPPLVPDADGATKAAPKSPAPQGAPPSAAPGAAEKKPMPAKPKTEGAPGAAK